MSDPISDFIIDDAVAEALALNLSFLNGPGQCRHVPFTFTASPVQATTLRQLERVALLLGRLTQALASRDELIQAVHAPLAAGDPFFAELLSIHRELHNAPEQLQRVPLLLQRSDFMLDQLLGPQLVECNSIAAGMAPFGDRVQQLHHYLKRSWPEHYAQFHTKTAGDLSPNPATANMAAAIASAAQQMARDLDDEGDPGFLMVVQECEDNLFDQRLLECQLRDLGLRTYRRTFRQLHQQLSSGPNQSLQLEGCGTIHLVYLRAGYQYQDYIATDLDTRRCCDALGETRMFIERHRVAVNATVTQQLATSKRMQLELVHSGEAILAELGFDAQERGALKAVFAGMQAVDAHSRQWLTDEANVADWVLKNQGEGGGHCLFDTDILTRLDAMTHNDYGAWTLMQRLRPAGREQTTLVVRNGVAQAVQGLVSEIGIFTAHLGEQALPTHESNTGHIGYLVRSTPPDVTESGVHSGFGALDSLFVQNC
ncbi:MAG: glutathione synthase [Halioglobus sp.]